MEMIIQGFRFTVSQNMRTYWDTFPQYWRIKWTIILNIELTLGSCRVYAGYATKSRGTFYGRTP